MTTMDYRRNAADTVMRKSRAALELLTTQQNAVRLGAVGLADRDAPVDEALIAETKRAFDMARAALTETRDTNEEEGRDG